VILVDVNFLLYAHDRSSPVYEAARRWFLNAMEGPEPVALPWTSILGFIRLSTSPRIFQSPFSIEEAVHTVESWLSQPAATLLHTGEEHWPHLRDLLLKTGTKGPLVTDAHLAALALEHQATLLTRDGDFSRFPEVRTINPLASEPL
jgi:toxin-antitoxin system PIN domain toxin